jgi:hypothetical protein
MALHLKLAASTARRTKPRQLFPNETSGHHRTATHQDPMDHVTPTADQAITLTFFVPQAL